MRSLENCFSDFRRDLPSLVYIGYILQSPAQDACLNIDKKSLLVVHRNYLLSNFIRGSEGS